MNNDFYNMERNTSLQGIGSELHGIKVAMKDKLYLEVHGKEAYLEMVEKRKFRQQVSWCGFGAFLVGFFGVGLYLCNWNMNELLSRLGNFFMNLF
jgi:hypothetical protein